MINKKKQNIDFYIKSIPTTDLILTQFGDACKIAKEGIELAEAIKSQLEFMPEHTLTRTEEIILKQVNEFLA